MQGVQTGSVCVCVHVCACACACVHARVCQQVLLTHRILDGRGNREVSGQRGRVGQQPVVLPGPGAEERLNGLLLAGCHHLATSNVAFSAGE